MIYVFVCLVLIGVLKRRVGVWWNDINFWLYYYVWFLIFLNEEEVLMMFVVFYYILGIMIWGVSLLLLVVLDMWE